MVVMEIGDVLEELERWMAPLPLPDVVKWNQGKLEQVPLTTSQKIGHYVANIFKTFGYVACAILSIPIGFVYSMGRWVVSLFRPTPKNEPMSPVDPSALPDHFGLADSLFQTSGLGTSASATPLPGLSDWEAFMNPERLEGVKSPEEIRQFFIDVLRNPQPFIDILRKMNVTAHRFSLERAVIEPQKGQYDREAIALYRNFIQKLKDNGIEPYVTIQHFVCPKWFAEEGAFTQLENVENFKNHALAMMEMFPEVTNWMTFNEINFDGFQKYVRCFYPPALLCDMANAVRGVRKLLVAHSAM